MDDLISRQAAIEAMLALQIEDEAIYGGSIPEGFDGDRAAEALKKLPSAVVRCKECKWWDQKDDSPFGYCHAMKHAYYSSHWEIGIYRTYKADWFCADGERK